MELFCIIKRAVNTDWPEYKIQYNRFDKHINKSYGSRIGICRLPVTPLINSIAVKYNSGVSN